MMATAKVDDMKPFMMKHCKQGGALTSTTNLNDLFDELNVFFSILDRLFNL